MEFNTKTNAGQISPVLETGFLIVFDWGAGHFAHNPALSLSLFLLALDHE